MDFFDKIGLNVLVHAAGIVVNGNTMSLSVEDYDRCMNINARSAFIITQKVLPHLLETKGSIVHVSSVTGIVEISSYFKNAGKSETNFQKLLLISFTP